MVNNGGSSFFVVLILVFVVFGAGYLFAQSSQVEVQNKVADAALQQAVRANATLAPQATQAAVLQGDLQTAQAALAAAKVELEAASAARAKAEADLAAVSAAKAQAESALARTSAELETAKSGLAAAAEQNKMLLNASMRQQARIAELEGMIPVAGGQSASANGKLTYERFLPWLGAALVGLVLGAAAYGALRTGSHARKNHPASPFYSEYTLVKMTREEARKYARGKALRGAQG